MSTLFKLFIFLTTVVSASTEVNTRQLIDFDVMRNGSKVGDGYLAVIPKGDKTEVDYRLSVKVQVAFITAFSLSRQQYGVFDKDGNLIYARSSTEENGERHEVEVCAQGQGAVRVRRNGSEDVLEKDQYVMTTLNVVYQTPRDGTWLDLNKGQLVRYQVEQEGGTYLLVHGKETDRVFKDPNGLLNEFVTDAKGGEIKVQRTGASSQEQGEEVSKRFDKMEAVRRSESCNA